MSRFSDNIRYLRVQKRISQESVALDLKITRGRYVKYEDGTTEPPYDILQRISQYHHLSIDLLLSVDVRKVSVENLLKLEDNRILLPIKVDASGKNLIEIVPVKAKAGYVTGYGDPEFIDNLPLISLPFLGTGKHRAFPVSGDSMPPHTDASFIVGRYIENLGELKKGKTYIFILPEDIVYKRLGEKKAKSLIVESDNTFYEPYTIKLTEILEIWEFACSLTTEEAKLQIGSNLESILLAMRSDIQRLEKSIKHN
jgi:transcriptional regulator with XRE-family HTH domain